MAAFADDEDYQVSDEEKLAIASQFLLSSPPGEIKEVLGDVKTLCPNLLSEDVLSSVFRNYNNKMMEVVSGVVCDEATQIEPDHYMDFSSGKVVKIDPVSQTVTDDDVADVEPVSCGSLEQKRGEVEEALKKYVKQQYVGKTTVVNVAVQGKDLIVLVSGQKLNLKNYWGGRWQSRFTVSESDGISGVIGIRIHYFEDGNVQMDTERHVENVSLSSFTGEGIAKEIANQESQVQTSLEEMYTNMSKETFKDMRRVLPITRQKMDWSGAQMQLAKGFGSSK